MLLQYVSRSPQHELILSRHEPTDPPHVLHKLFEGVERVLEIGCSVWLVHAISFAALFKSLHVTATASACQQSALIPYSGPGNAFLPIALSFPP